VLHGSTGGLLVVAVEDDPPIGAVGVFLLFGSLTLVALLYFWREVPETKGRSLQEIERDLMRRGVG